MKTDPIIVEQLIDVKTDKVWKALTDKDEMKSWYFELKDFKPQVGFKFDFLGGAEYKQYLHLCKVTEVEENKKLSYTWQYDNYEGNSVVTWEIFETATGSRVKLTHTGTETFPKDDPNFARKSFEAGWNHIVRTSLKEYLEK
ncbi:SRPBCC family protein [Pedobacter punctiformis]|uniref:SRPBCC domain-containing protein n=1 Tax=Pedobacter punctiformis TaxID=3004097 RepID=A0ABT4LCB5_9SPHI|nr:SRPBCC domain-containing protein [Pedobacter sp. HCMS5-2]MCZ4244788.1 SRPBCC domain-containing protein [Pedobacter sp. HCMS5-2]